MSISSKQFCSNVCRIITHPILSPHHLDSICNTIILYYDLRRTAPNHSTNQTKNVLHKNVPQDDTK